MEEKALGSQLRGSRRIWSSTSSTTTTTRNARHAARNTGCTFEGRREWPSEEISLLLTSRSNQDVKLGGSMKGRWAAFPSRTAHIQSCPPRGVLAPPLSLGLPSPTSTPTSSSFPRLRKRPLSISHLYRSYTAFSLPRTSHTPLYACSAVGRAGWGGLGGFRGGWIWYAALFFPPFSLLHGSQRYSSDERFLILYYRYLSPQVRRR